MFGSLLKRLIVSGSLLVGATSGVSASAVLAQAAQDCSAIQFEIANPAPGARVDPGTYVLQGIALDTRSETGPGIDHVDIFLGDRNAGGSIIGHAVPGIGGPFDANSFSAAITLPNQIGGQQLFAYALSAVTGDESVISFPIAVGVDPSKAGGIMTSPPESTCHSAAAGAPAAAEETPMPAEEQPAMEPPVQEQPAMEPPVQDQPAPEAEAPAAEEGQPEAAPSQEMAPPPRSQMYLDVGNPSPGDSIHVGGYMIEGIAFDRAAEQSPGIEHIDIFLDNRDTGGTLIGHGVMGAPNPVPDDPSLTGSGWTAQVTLTPRMTGGHTMYFYALSAATGEEMVVGVPVSVVP